jgi:hypothetical protein
MSRHCEGGVCAVSPGYRAQPPASITPRGRIAWIRVVDGDTNDGPWHVPPYDEAARIVTA